MLGCCFCGCAGLFNAFVCFACGYCLMVSGLCLVRSFLCVFLCEIRCLCVLFVTYCMMLYSAFWGVVCACLCVCVSLCLNAFVDVVCDLSCDAVLVVWAFVLRLCVCGVTNRCICVFVFRA